MASERRKTIATVLGPVKVMPECKAQAVCVNGSKCWEAGCCLRAPAGDCDYAEMDWCCCKRAGHDGPHESAPLGRGGEQPVRTQVREVPDGQ